MNAGFKQMQFIPGKTINLLFSVFFLGTSRKQKNRSAVSSWPSPLRILYIWSQGLCVTRKGLYFLGWDVAWYALLLKILNGTDLPVEIKI